MKTVNGSDIGLERDGYGFRYYFNAGLNPVTCQCDEEGVDVFREYRNGNWGYLGSIPCVTIADIEDMSDEEFYKCLDENGIC